MPLYEFQCEACEHRFERIQKFTDPNPDTCPNCGRSPVRKLPSSPAIQFKGSGFYITDYAKKSSPDSSSSKSSDGSGSSSSSSSSGDSKSESKSDSKSESKTESKSGESKSTESKATDSKS